VSASPLVVEPPGLVVISLGSGGPGGALAAYDVSSGERKWVAGTDKASYSSPMLTTSSGRQFVVSVNDKTVTGHDPADGTVVWEYAWRPSPAKASQPVQLPGDRLLLTTDYNVPDVLLQLTRDGDRWTAQEVWTANHLETNFSTAVVRDHYAYGLNDGALACINLDDGGAQVWQAPRSDRFGYGQLLLVEDLLIVQAESGDVALVKADPSGYHKLGVLHAFSSKTWSNPALAGNQLFLRNDREAACYELATVADPSGK
jgi:outer membrane protein assembly factor BamB